MTAEEALFSRHRGKQVLLDSNLLLLLLIGSFERSLITRFKRTAQFSAEDFDVLANLLSVFRNVVTTPHVLTEVSNLANSLPARLKFDWHQHLAQHTSRLWCSRCPPKSCL